jgi:glycine cleavage system H lipoate-binding protein
MKVKKHSPTVKGFQVVENQCIWMKAGIVSFRLCDNAYDCQSCPFDKAMQKTVKAGRRPDDAGWTKNLGTLYKWTDTPCRHVLTGRITAPKTCTMNYECYHCAYDQMLDEEDRALKGAAPSCSKASGYRLANEYYYHPGHTWARFDHGGRVRIGFDDFLVKLFGAPSHIALAPLGGDLKKNHAGITFYRSGKKATAVSPITGSVLAVNTKVAAHPQIVHEDPYHEGWLCIIEPNMPKRNLRGLFYGKESLEWTDRESHRLLSLMGSEYQALAATGGEPVDDVYSRFPEIGWDRLAATFLAGQRQ